jgi:hypothetical protein
MVQKVFHIDSTSGGKLFDYNDWYKNAQTEAIYETNFAKKHRYINRRG